jgi:pimeloyl-ACP methyl ester carboxylesterase
MAASPKARAQAAILDAFQRCRERLVAEGIDLSAYHSAASAADVNDLRVALGLPSLNLYAVSYGTRLALTILRDFPETVRSAVLDSTYPLQVNLYTSLAPNAERAFNVLFDRCATDPTCSIAYPDLKNVFYDLVNQLNDSPAEVDLQSSGGKVKIRLDGDRLIDVLLVGLYNPSVAAQIPAMIFAIRQGDYAILRARLQLYFDNTWPQDADGGAVQRGDPLAHLKKLALAQESNRKSQPSSLPMSSHCSLPAASGAPPRSTRARTSQSPATGRS